MTANADTNDTIVSENHNNIIITYNLIGVTECGNWNICYTASTGKQTYKPTDPDYYNKRDHERKEETSM